MCEVIDLALRKAPVVGVREHSMKLRLTQRGGGRDFLNLSSVIVNCKKNRPAVNLRNGTTSQVRITSPSILSFFF